MIPVLLVGGKRIKLAKQQFTKVAELKGVLGVSKTTVAPPTRAKQQADRWKAYRMTASALAAKANKRLNRLEKNGLTEVTAYKKFMEGGGAKFGIQGKTNAEVKAEMNRLNKFLDDVTSTISGVNKRAAVVADRFDIKYKNYKELRDKNKVIFELLAKAEQYINNSTKLDTYYDSDQLMDSVVQYVEGAKVALNDNKMDIDEAVAHLEKELVAQQEALYDAPSDRPPSFFTPVSD